MLSTANVRPGLARCSEFRSKEAACGSISDTSLLSFLHIHNLCLASSCPGDASLRFCSPLLSSPTSLHSSLHAQSASRLATAPSRLLCLPRRLKHPHTAGSASFAGNGPSDCVGQILGSIYPSYSYSSLHNGTCFNARILPPPSEYLSASRRSRVPFPAHTPRGWTVQSKALFSLYRLSYTRQRCSGQVTRRRRSTSSSSLWIELLVLVLYSESLSAPPLSARLFCS